MAGVRISSRAPMPEGPEVRRHADAVARAVAGQRVVEVSARTKLAKAWLAERPGALVGRRLERVWAHGKHLVGQFEAGPAGDAVGFHSHLMMWGRWLTFPDTPPEAMPPPDRRERARIVTEHGAALLHSAPVFTLFEGDPYAAVPILGTLGPDALPYAGPEAFDAPAFLHRLDAHGEREVGAALLDQSVVAGLGNYLRAEILFLCRLDPFRRVDTLTRVTAQAYTRGGVTLATDDVARMVAEPALVYTPDRAWQQRHYVFRRTNLPCLVCGTPVRQLRQVTRAWEDDEGSGKKERIIYFCPTCQGVDVPERNGPRRQTVPTP
jgi:endonuclease VIII